MMIILFNKYWRNSKYIIELDLSYTGILQDKEIKVENLRKSQMKRKVCVQDILN